MSRTNDPSCLVSDDPFLFIGFSRHRTRPPLLSFRVVRPRQEITRLTVLLTLQNLLNVGQCVTIWPEKS